jgi:4-amino-4-deoxy-L-arabinose transferase-like glycosyltransferase
LLPLLGLWALLYASFSFTRPALRDGADAMHAQMAREMVLRHDWITPHLNGIRLLDHPPLLVWSIAASFKAFGVAVWSARIPLALFSLLLFFAAFTLGRRLYQSIPAGFYASLILISSLGVFLFAHLLVPQVASCLWTLLALRFFWISLEEAQPSRRTAFGFAACCALGALTSGVPGVLVPAATALLFLALTRNLRHVARWHPLSGVLLFLLIAAPWHIAAGIANPSEGAPVNTPTAGQVHGLYWDYFVNRNFLWYLHHGQPAGFDSLPILLFLAYAIVWLLPWTAFLVRALAFVPIRKAARRTPLDRREQAMLLPALWALVALVFFILVPRGAADTMLVLPPLALVVGAWLAHDEAGLRHGARRIAAVLLALGLAAAAIALVAALRQHPSETTGLIRPELSSLHHHLSLARLSVFRLSLGIFAAAATVGTVANLFFRLRNHARLANCFLAGMMVAILAAAHMALMMLSPVYSSRILADAIRPEIANDDLVVVHGNYEDASSFSFYLDRQVHVLNGRDGALWYGSFFNDAPAIFEDNASLAKQWNGPLRVYLWTSARDIPPLPGTVYLIGQSGGKEVLSNQPNSGGAEF